MSLLWSRTIFSKAGTVKLLLRPRTPSVWRPSTLVAQQHYQLYHSSEPTSSVDATLRKMRRLDKRSNIDKEAAKQVLSPQQEVLHKLGIANDTLKSSTARLNDASNPQNKQQLQQSIPPSLHVRVRSVHAAQNFDVVKILQKVFSPDPKMMRHTFGKTSLIVQLKPNTPGEPFRFVAVYRYGSVVFFNMTTQEAGKLLERIKQYGTKSIAAGFERRENFGIVVQPQLAQLDLKNDQIVTGDYCAVESLDMNSVSVIASIMSQTVALDSFNDIAEALLTEFSSINTKVKQHGKFTDIEKNNLFRVVAQNNAIFIEMISKLGIKERSDTAWNLSEYEQIHEGLKEEFEIETRFSNIGKCG